jgi:hypothetical protein
MEKDSGYENFKKPRHKRQNKSYRNGTQVIEMNKFIYLESKINSEGKINGDIEQRDSKTSKKKKKNNL